MAAEMEFCLLGPLLVRRGGVVVPVSAGRQRALLAALLLSANRVVSLGELAEALWGSVPPPSARASLQTYVMRLRQSLGDAGRCRIICQPGGYLISLRAGELDVDRFGAALAAGREAIRAGSHAAAASRLETALLLWRGQPLAGVSSEMLVLREVPRLEEMRLQALEARSEAYLQLTRHAEVIIELRQLAAAYPLRERLHALLMLALYRDGQQAGALAAYRAARAVLVGELGAEPGPELRRLQQQILAADTALDALSPAAAGGSGPGPAAAVPGQRSGPVVPRQLPAAAAHSAGRAAELKVLDESAGAGGNVAHRRFASAVAAHLFAASPSPTFEQFTERAGRVVAAASQAAAVTGQETVTTVDLLLGLFSEPDGVAGRVLAAMNVSEQSVRAAIRAAHSGAADDGTADSCNALVASGGAGPAGAEDGTAESRPAFDHDARHALQKALATALQLGHSYIGTEHILLGLYWDEENRNVAAKVLVQAGAPETVARAHISEMLRGFTTSS